MNTRSSENKILITGASGLLGRSIFKTFLKEGWNVYGTAFTRWVFFRIHFLLEDTRLNILYAPVSSTPKYFI